MKKRILPAVLILCLLLCSCSQTTTTPAEAVRDFTDSTGRTLTVPAEIDAIAITGPLSQIYILPLAGDLLVGVSNAYTEDSAPYLPAYLFEKTEIGQLYGGKGEMDLEALLQAAPDVVIDIGEPKDSIANDLDALTAQTGIPFLHVDATVSGAGDGYRMLGDLLNRQEQAETLAQWCETTYQSMIDLMARVDADGARKSLLYCLGDDGTNVIAQGSFHGETINFLGSNLAVIEEVVAAGAGNEVDLEQILLWNPEVLLFAPDSCYDAVGESPQWQSAQAVASGSYYETPSLPYGWLSSPPSVQRYLGMLWLGQILYPEYVEYDLQEEVTTYYQLFYGCTLTDELYQTLMKNSL